MKKIILILTILFSLISCNKTQVLATEKYTINKITEKESNSTFKYELITFENERYKILESSVNEFVMNKIDCDKKYINDNNIEWSDIASEIFFNVGQKDQYFTVNITYWFYIGSHPEHNYKTFTYDIQKRKFVNLAEISGLNGKKIYNQIVKQYYDKKYDLDYPFDSKYFIKENTDFFDKLENMSYTIDENGCIYLLFPSNEFFGKPDFDFILKT